jgi:1,2-dihydroxy-3-keto-5-methylthiopentene dioxygenase
MSHLRLFAVDNATQPLLESSDAGEISAVLANAGIRFEQWQAGAPLSSLSSNDDILQAYAADIQRLKHERGYITVDVISLSANHPDKAALRQKFLAEHTHSEDEVRFFVRGQGLFCLHIAGKVYQVLCQQNDLISVPAGTTHWFDMGSEPEFSAIRLFNNPDGWVAKFSGSDIALRFPLLT